MENYNAKQMLAKEFKPMEETLLRMNEPMEQKIEALDLEYMQSLFPVPDKCWDKEITISDAILYVYRPDKKTKDTMPLIYFTHGGGGVSGNANQSSAELKHMANIHHAIVVSVEYRLATKASFPAAINDIYNGLKYCFNNADKLCINKSHIVTMGESFGGGATAAMNIYNRDHDNIPICGQILVYPMLDHRTGNDKYLCNNPYTGELGWTRRMNRICWDVYRGNNYIAHNDMPYYSPSTVECLENMPETFILVGSIDLFVDEDIEFAKRLMRSGTNVELHIIPGVFHCFDMMNPDAPQTKDYKEMRFKAIERMFNK